ncbi:8276_t:CDS:2 [Diversispora eburnea]|uniref:8276_t:CDS:1 n=1 Tax=Diversispora eburnea TaxID=1213867 RepID=A0A9N8YSH5_9GLOM|nr:8276_t:CDS:2 [Diversispora eburnea]
MPRDLVTELKEDHRVIKNLWEVFSRSRGNEEKQAVANTIIREVSIHAACEELSVYPLLEKHFGKHIAEESRQEHLEVKKELKTLDSMKVGEAGFITLLEKTLKEFIVHSEKEELEILPKFQEKVTEDELLKLGKKFVEDRQTAPTHPHPEFPLEPEEEAKVAHRAARKDKKIDESRMFIETGRIYV